MVKTFDNEAEFISEYVKYIESANDAMSKNDYRKNNRIVDKFIKFIKQNSSKEFFKTALEGLMNFKNFNVHISAATNSLKYNVNIDKAKKILKDSSKRKDIGISALNAEMALKVYNGEIPGKKL
jgi:uncharacterized protein YlxP (DUF503 family)